MKIKFDLRSSFLLIFLPFFLFSCAQHWHPNGTSEEVKKQDLSNFPYHPLVYHLDLSILAYQLYGQSLVWPFDPYYEEANSKRGRRSVLMRKVRSWAYIKGAAQVKMDPGIRAYRGPGILNGFKDNPRHDPIIYRYDRIYPWSSNISNPYNSWTEYLVPNEITNRIKDVYVSYRKVGKPIDSVAIDKVVTKTNEQDSNARDVLLAFEGGTGDKGIEGHPASQSLMGFVLIRYYPNKSNFDIHIAFRGSRSGSGARAARQALKDDKAKGNPDWITDLGYNLIGPETGAGSISKIGSVSRGMSTCMTSIHPNLFGCLKKVAEITDAAIPERIFITGHSLGGGLAQVFASSIILGDQYNLEEMPTELQQWPWKQMKLVTFAAPRVGDEEWAEKLTVEGLSSDFFSTTINPYDKNALNPIDTTILPQMFDLERPSGFRVLAPSDPITTEKIPGGKHVGKTVYVSKPRMFDTFVPVSFKGHEPAYIRKLLMKGLSDTRIPNTAWKTQKMKNLNPDRDKSQKGSIGEYVKLATSIERYYSKNNIYFDSKSFKLDFNLFLEIYNSK